MVSHERFMAQALRLAKRGLYSCHPNPRVGCVLVRDGRVVGHGWHRRCGDAHAERMALQQAGADARGATAYITLEPCCHQGRTPPCTKALQEAAVASVVIATGDPDPRVNGAGISALREAGIAVVEGVLRAEAEALNAGFFSRHQRCRPWLRLKMASSLDGRSALSDGRSRWISNAFSRRDVQHWRARSDALLTTSTTVIADDPRLNARVDGLADVDQPLRVILDRCLRISPDANLFKQVGKVLLFCDAAACRERMLVWQQAPLLRLHRLPHAGDSLDLAAVMAELANQQINEVQAEVGSRMAAALLAAGLVDEVLLYMALHVLGNSPHGLVDRTLSKMAERWSFTLFDMRHMGNDLRLRLRPVV